MPIARPQERGTLAADPTFQGDDGRPSRSSGQVGIFMDLEKYTRIPADTNRNGCWGAGYPRPHVGQTPRCGSSHDKDDARGDPFGTGSATPQEVRRAAHRQGRPRIASMEMVAATWPHEHHWEGGPWICSRDSRRSTDSQIEKLRRVPGRGHRALAADDRDDQRAASRSSSAKASPGCGWAALRAPQPACPTER